MTRVFDVFPLGYETDVLLLRLETLADVVDEFCIVEGDRTFTGAPRDWLWMRGLNRDPRFAPFLDRISWHGVEIHDDPEWPFGREQWERERVLRGAMLPLVDAAGAGPDDIVIVSDADEIPHPDAIRWAREHLTLGTVANERFGDTSLIRLPGHYHQLKLDLRAINSLSPEYLWEWRQPLIGRRSAFTHAQHDRAERQKAEDTLTAPSYVPRGWHMTCMGTFADIAAKLKAYSHTEYGVLDSDDIEQCYRNRRAVAHAVHLDQVSLAELPAPVRQDPARWAHMLAQPVEVLERG